MTSLEVIVSGRVQGVWYRGWTVDQAHRLGVNGSVRNLPDGTVQVIVCGPSDKVDALLDLLWQGPPLAQVSDVRSIPTEAPTAPGFHQV